MEENGSNSPAGEGATLRELAERLLAPHDPYDELSAAPPRLYVGRLPDDIPVELPIPDGATIVGSLVRDLSRRRRLDEVVLDATQPADWFHGTYRRQLLAAGWTEDEEGPGRPGRSGFVPRNLPMHFRAAYRFPRLRRRLGLDRPELPPIFRPGSRGPKLTIVAQDRRDALTDVRLHLLTGQRDPWLEHDPAWTVVPGLSSPPGAHNRPEMQHIEVLHTPPGARPLGGGRHVRDAYGAYSYAVLKTNLDLPTLAAHYTDQLEGAGWSRMDGGTSEGQTWSTWTFSDTRCRPWTGTFEAVRLLGTPERYLLQIHADRTPDHQ